MDTRFRSARSILSFLALLVLSLLPTSVSYAAAQSTSGPLGPSLPITPALGVKKVLVAGCYFSDTDDVGALANATSGIKSMYGPATEQGTIANYFANVSNGKLQIQSEVIGWYPLPHGFDYYNTDATRTQTRTDCPTVLASAKTTSDYDVVVMLFNQDVGDSNFTYGTASTALVALRPWGGHGGWVNQATHIHELGHAFGLPHDSTLAQTDESSPYDNEYDSMSDFDESTNTKWFWGADGWCDGYWPIPNGKDDHWSTLPKCVYEATDGAKHVGIHYAAFQKVRLGWLSDGPQNTALFYGGQQSFHLQAVGTPNVMTGVQMIAAPAPVSGSKVLYTVEYRQKDVDYYEQGLRESAVIVYRIDPALSSSNLGDGRRAAVLRAGESYTTWEGTTFSVSATDPSQVSVTGPFPTASLTSLTPNYAASATDPRTTSVPVTVTGAGFVSSTVAVWPGLGMIAGQKAGGGYVDAQTLRVGIPNAWLKSGHSAFIGVTNGPSDDPSASGQQPFWVTPSGAATADSASAAVSGTAKVAAGKLSVDAAGASGAIAATRFASNPGSNATYSAAGAERWFGVLGNSITATKITDCDLNNGDGLNYWLGSTWAPVAPAATLNSAGCLEFNLTTTSQPALADLTNGVHFSVTRHTGFGPLTAPAPVAEGSPVTLAGAIVNPSATVMTLKADWGDGHVDTVALAANATAYSATHTYGDNPKGSGQQGAYAVRLSLLDSHATQVATASTSITVKNVAPSVELRTLVQSTAPNTPVTLYVHFADPGYRPDGDTLSFRVNWGDGHVEPVAIPFPQIGTALQHSYDDNPAGGLGHYVISFLATDDDGASGGATTPMTVTFGVPPTQVVMCFDASFGGSCRLFLVDEPNLLANTGFNDQISSIKISGPATVAVFSDINYSGTCETFTASDTWLGDNRIGNDAISSVRLGVTCP